MIFITPKRMTPYLYVACIIIIGFIGYLFVKDYIFGDSFGLNTFINQMPSMMSSVIPSVNAPIEILQAPLYPPRVVSPSGPNPPNTSSENTVIHPPPQAKDPYYEAQESSDIPENLRHPERSFRPPPLSNNTTVAVHSGIASTHTQPTSTQSYQEEFIQGGGEFMPGIFANDTLDDKTFSAF